MLKTLQLLLLHYFFLGNYELITINVVAEASLELRRQTPGFNFLICDRSQLFRGGMTNLIGLPQLLISEHIESKNKDLIIKHPFSYSEKWIGTSLPLLDLATAVEIATPLTTPLTTPNDRKPKYRWAMGRWPDPILRRSAESVDLSLLGTDMLQQACDILRNTAIAEGAVGLAAQQCGVNARIVYVEVPSYGSNSYIIMINPKIQDRSPETKMLAWRESCLVLPSTFQATILRDAWVDVAYFDWKSKRLNVVRLHGQLARAVQHEMDHDRGILITDHVSLDELENDLMRAIERPAHERRMMIAYSRDA
jgi:peptide deformylase